MNLKLPSAFTPFYERSPEKAGGGGSIPSWPPPQPFYFQHLGACSSVCVCQLCEVDARISEPSG
jgi:hypothetical protein